MSKFEEVLAVFGFLNFIVTVCVIALAKVFNVHVVHEGASLWLMYTMPFTLFSVFYLIAQVGGESEE